MVGGGSRNTGTHMNTQAFKVLVGFPNFRDCKVFLENLVRMDPQDLW